MKKAIKKNGDKKEILMELNGFVNKYDFEGDINEVVEKIKTIPARLLDTYPLNMEYKKAHRFSIRQDTESADYYSNDTVDIYILQIYRWETDEELKNRLELNKKQSAAAKEREFKKKEAAAKREKTIYESLKKKFEGV
jgi:hypothetical protein